MKPRQTLAVGGLLGLLGLVLMLGATDTIQAGTFTPTLEVTMADASAGAHSDFTVDFNLPEGDVNFAGIVSFLPGEWGITPGEDIPIGAVVGKLSSEPTLGLINGACNNPLPVEFIMLNSSIDPTDTVSFVDTDDTPPEDFVDDKDESGLPDGFEKYPDFITRALVDEQDEPLQPIRRSAGITVVAGVNVLLQFLVFEPGTFINENIPHDAELGYPSVVLLQNIGDPDVEPVPGAITDFCTPLVSSNLAYGVTQDNVCTDDVPVDELDPLCAVTGAVPKEDEEPTEPDESGVNLYTNPAEGSYTFTTIAVGQRDADDDGYENSLDTCLFLPNLGNPRVTGDGDLDGDGLDGACDPDDNVVNSDQDSDGYLNRQDNCPLDANGENEVDVPNVGNQTDPDKDTVGTACDPNPDDEDAQGELKSATLEQEVQVGPGTGNQETPTATETPSADGGDDDGGSGTLIIIIIAIIAAVVVLGGGAYFFMRRGGGGGASA